MLPLLTHLVETSETKIHELPARVSAHISGDTTHPWLERLSQANWNIPIFLKLTPPARRQFLGYASTESTMQYLGYENDPKIQDYYGCNYNADVICEFFGFIRFNLRPGQAITYSESKQFKNTLFECVSVAPLVDMIHSYTDFEATQLHAWKNDTAKWFYSLSRETQHAIMNAYVRE
jgi:hypothetical protein